MENNENNMNQSKKRGSSIGIIICLIIIIGLCCYIAYDKGLFGLSNKEVQVVDNKDNKEDKKEEETPVKEEIPITNLNLSFDPSKCSNCDSNYDYTINAGGELAYTELSADGKSIMIYLEAEQIKNAGDTTINVKTTEQKVTFNKKVIDVIYTGYGLDISYDTLLYLMEDGTVEYTPILYAASKNDIKSYGQVGSLTNIVKFYTNIEASSKSGVGGYKTTFAQSSDGTIYDIMSMLAETSNYPYSG